MFNMPRTNMADAAAYRLCVEYKSMMDVLVIIEGEEVDGHLEEVEEHFIKISNFETLKSMSAYHKKAMEGLKQHITDAIAKVKNANQAPKIDIVQLK
tara:strand:- start:1815 stop:2105 length:291 start_codon:yes stop_codon:yes gene_type:complete